VRPDPESGANIRAGFAFAAYTVRMDAPRRNRRAVVALVICVGAGVLLSFPFAFGGTDSAVLDVVEIVVTLTGGALFGLFTFFFPYAIVYLGLRKLREQRQREFAALGDDNTVTADPEGERKTHEYLTAITSTEARIGLLQRSQPWPGKTSEPTP